MRNIGRGYFRIAIEEVNSNVRDINGAVVPEYTQIGTAWAKKRIGRQGSSSVKRLRQGVELNTERLEFTVNHTVQVDWDNIINHKSERYEIAAIAEFKDEKVIVCYTTPLSNTRG